MTRSKCRRVPKLSSVLDISSRSPFRRESDLTFGSFNNRSQSCKHLSALDFSLLRKLEKSSAHSTISVVLVQLGFGVSMSNFTSNRSGFSKSYWKRQKCLDCLRYMMKRKSRPLATTISTEKQQLSNIQSPM